MNGRFVNRWKRSSFSFYGSRIFTSLLKKYLEGGGGKKGVEEEEEEESRNREYSRRMVFGRCSRRPIIRTVPSFERGEAWRVDEKGK